MRLLVDGRVVHSATGRNQERLRTVRWDVSPFHGHPARLEIVDQATSSWGHIQVDEVWLVP